MTFMPRALCILGAMLVICLQLSNGSAIPKSCKCVSGNSIDFLPLNKIKDFSIQERGDQCGTEIILKTNDQNVPEICLNAEKRQGKRLQDCWTKTIQEDKSRKQECLRRGRK